MSEPKTRFLLKVKNKSTGNVFECEEYWNSKQEIEYFWARFEAEVKIGSYRLVSCEGPIRHKS